MTGEATHRTGVKSCPSCGGEVWHCSRCGSGLPGISVDSRALSISELSALFAVCLWDTSPAGVRDAAIITMLYAVELSRQEVVALDLEDWSQLTASVTIRARGSRGERKVCVAEKEAETITRWILTRGPHPGSLFVPVDLYGRLMDRRLLSGAIGAMLSRRSRQAGIKTARTRDLHYTHRLRHAPGTARFGLQEGLYPGETGESRNNPEAKMQPVESGGAAALEHLPEEELRKLRDRINSILLRRGTTDRELNDGPGSQYGKGWPYPEETKLKVVEAVRAGTSPTQVSRMFGIGLHTVRRWARMAQEGKSLRPQLPVGTPPVADPEMRQWLESDLELHPYDTLISRRERLWEATGVKPPATSAIWKQIRLWGFVYADGRWMRLE